MTCCKHSSKRGVYSDKRPTLREQKELKQPPLTPQGTRKRS